MLSFTLTATYTYGQKKQIYFVADTLSLDKYNRFIEAGSEGQMGYYVFYCKCIAPNNNYLTFSYKKIEYETQILNKKPDYKYSSLKDLLDIVTKSQSNFDDQYDLFITEKLPDNKYKTNKVSMVILRTLEPDVFRGKPMKN